MNKPKAEITAEAVNQALQAGAKSLTAVAKSLGYKSGSSGVLKTLQKDGMTIIVSSHILAELEEYCTAMLVIRDGQIRENVVLSAHQSTSTVTIGVTLARALDEDQERDIRDQLGDDFKPVVGDRTHLFFTTPANANSQYHLLRNLMDLRIPVSSFTPQEKKLQTLYLELAQERTRGQA